jgi:hypothetical protein
MLNIVAVLCFLAALIGAVLGIFGVSAIAHLDFWVWAFLALGFLLDRVGGVIVIGPRQTP